MTTELLLNFLNKTAGFQAYIIHQFGSDWFQNNFMKNLINAETILKNEHELLAENWFVAGNVLEMVDAPLQALDFYKKALTFQDDHWDAVYQMVHIFNDIGEYKKALDYITKLTDSSDPDEGLLIDKQRIQDNFNYLHQPLLMKGNIIWESNEKIAKGHYQDVLLGLELRKEKDLFILKTINKAYGALNLKKKYLEGWKVIFSNFVEIELDYGDWFYMPKSVLKSKEIWNLFKLYNHNITVGSAFKAMDGLMEILDSDENETELRKIICDFFIYKISGNFYQLENMKLKYPNWEEIKYIDW